MLTTECFALPQPEKQVKSNWIILGIEILFFFDERTNQMNLLEDHIEGLQHLEEQI